VKERNYPVVLHLTNDCLQKIFLLILVWNTNTSGTYFMLIWSYF